MSRTCTLVIAALALACGHREEATMTPRAIPASVRAPDPIVPGVPHGGSIVAIAMTEAGDAALTVDDLGDARLWPSLDGKRPPIPVDAVGVAQVALGHAGDNLLAAFLSEAGDVLLVTYGRDGSVRGRAQLPDGSACESVVAIDDGVLVVRADLSIERYDAEARRRGRVVGASGERLAAIDARRGGAVALIARTVDDRTLTLPTGDVVGEATLVRQLVIDDGLHWGPSTELPGPVVANALALSPDHRHIAVVISHPSEVRVLGLATGAQVGKSVPVTTIGVTSGFTDDDHVAVLSSDFQWWRADADTTPPNVSSAIGLVGGVVGDGRAVGAVGASLAIGEPGTVHYLGWNRSAAGTLRNVDSAIMLAFPTNRGFYRDTVAWLDGRLGFSSQREITGYGYPVWLGPRHMMLQKNGALDLVDLDHPDKPVHIADDTAYQVFYEPTLRQFARYIAARTVERYALDLEHLSVKTLEPLQLSPEFSRLGEGRLDLLDPARADGVIAIARWYGRLKQQADQTHLAIYRVPSAGATLVRSSRELTVAEVLAVDATGAMYVRDKASGPIVVRRDGKPDVTLAGLVATELSPSHSGNLLAALHGNEVTLLDVAGIERWRVSMWKPTQVIFSSDDRHVIVQSDGGIVSLDVTTGTGVTSACAFDFGLHDHRPAIGPLHAEPICRARP
jgi:hypothetical protein